MQHGFAQHRIQTTNRWSLFIGIFVFPKTKGQQTLPKQKLWMKSSHLSALKISHDSQYLHVCTGRTACKVAQLQKNEKSRRLNAYYSIERCAFYVEAGKGWWYTVKWSNVHCKKCQLRNEFVLMGDISFCFFSFPISSLFLQEIPLNKLKVVLRTQLSLNYHQRKIVWTLSL